MVTYEGLREYLGRRPFEPFRINLRDGNAVDVMRRNQAVVSRRDFIVGIEDHFRFFRLDQLESLEPIAGELS